MMKLSEMQTNQEAIAEELRDPAFRAEWQRTALARAVALQVVRYRSDNELSQTQLGERLGMKQPQVARLERGDVNPTIDTLIKLSGVLEIEFTIDIHPTHRAPKLVNKRAQTTDAVTSFETERAAVLLAAV